MLTLRVITILMLCSMILLGKNITALKWESGQSFSEYLHSKHISLSVLDNISTKDLSFVLEIQGKQVFYELTNDKGEIEQILIPISQEMQLHLAKRYKSKAYIFEIITTSYEEKEYFGQIIIENNLAIDAKNQLHSQTLANKIGQLFHGTIDAKKFQKGDKISFIYDQKIRMGKLYYSPKIKIALYEHHGKKQFIYADEDGYGYTSSATSQSYIVKDKRKITYTRRVAKNKTNFIMPLRKIRITSTFSYKRYHPILKRYRPHHGTDFGAKRGTPLYAVANGKVSFSGRMGGYGNVIKIKHKGGYESLYAHQSKRRVKRGQRVKQGQVIGYVGSTGRSTGPHLHFGLKKHGKWINPMKVLKKSKKSFLKTFTKYETVDVIKYKEISIKNAPENKQKLLEYLENNTSSYIWKEVENESNKTL